MWPTLRGIAPILGAGNPGYFVDSVLRKRSVGPDALPLGVRMFILGQGAASGKIRVASPLETSRSHRSLECPSAKHPVGRALEELIHALKRSSESHRPFVPDQQGSRIGF